MRTAWVYAAQGTNFLLTMLRLMRERGAVRVVADQSGTPTAALSIARGLWRIAERPQVTASSIGPMPGWRAGTSSRCAIAEEAPPPACSPESRHRAPITTADYPTPARRPGYSVLDCSESSALIGLMPTPWRVRLRATLQSMAGRQAP